MYNQLSNVFLSSTTHFGEPLHWCMSFCLRLKWLKLIHYKKVKKKKTSVLGNTLETINPLTQTLTLYLLVNNCAHGLNVLNRTLKLPPRVIHSSVHRRHHNKRSKLYNLIAAFTFYFFIFTNFIVLGIASKVWKVLWIVSIGPWVFLCLSGNRSWPELRPARRRHCHRRRTQSTWKGLSACLWTLSRRSRGRKGGTSTPSRCPWTPEAGGRWRGSRLLALGVQVKVKIWSKEIRCNKSTYLPTIIVLECRRLWV